MMEYASEHWELQCEARILGLTAWTTNEPYITWSPLTHDHKVSEEEWMQRPLMMRFLFKVCDTIARARLKLYKEHKLGAEFKRLDHAFKFWRERFIRAQERELARERAAQEAQEAEERRRINERLSNKTVREIMDEIHAAAYNDTVRNRHLWGSSRREFDRVYEQFLAQHKQAKSKQLRQAELRERMNR